MVQLTDTPIFVIFVEMSVNKDETLIYSYIPQIVTP